jgi:hypothetical protein
MQIFLLTVTFILAVILYKMLSSRRATYPFIRTTRITRGDNSSEYLTTEAEQGLITIDKDAVIIEGVEYSLKGKKGKESKAFLNVEGGKLISIGIRLSDGEKVYFIDPAHSLYSNYSEASGSTETRHLFAV